MEEQIVNYIVGIAFVGILGASYIRYRLYGDKGRPESAVNIRQTMSEVKSYFSLSSDTEDRLTRSLDLAPVKMLSGLFRPVEKKQKSKDEERGKKK